MPVVNVREISGPKGTSLPSQSLYRKWRSKSFDDIMGQPHVVRTLQNAIRHNRVAHAYLFTGPRGTGKTSTARILAKAVNCLDPKDGAPCTVCRMCLSIAEGRSPDVIEIDGASNNSIDDVRVLRERVAYAPNEGRFKVYIIDEVHRLSGQAFDALLKTLEEPPEHVLFVFASTEPHKVPSTILSRCQRFDFRKIDHETTAARLAEVAAAEGLALDEDAKALIAQQAGGSLRDALGILDQVRTFAGDTIGADEVRTGTGIGRPQLIAGLTGLMLDGDPGGALSMIHEAVAQGVDPPSLGRQLIDYWRGLLLFACGAGAEVDLDPVLLDAAPSHAAKLTPSSAISALRALTEQVIEPRLSVSPMLPLEISVVQAILKVSPDVGSGNGDREPETRDRTRDRPIRAIREGAHTEALTTTSMQSEQEHSTSPLPEPIRPDGPVATHAYENTEALTTTSMQSEQEHSTSPLPEPIRPDGPVATNAHENKELVAIAADEATPPTNESPDDFGGFPAVWPRIIEAARARSRRLQAVLRDAEPVGWNDEEITLAFKYPLHRDLADSQENRAGAEAIIAEVMGARLRVHCILATAPMTPTQADDTDSFVAEAERMLRGVHARQFRSSQSDS
jgi:DNA polymerase III subunit gamma/tau